VFGLAHEASCGKSIRISVDTLVPPQVEGQSTVAVGKNNQTGESTLMRLSVSAKKPVISRHIQ
jgi:hypothetical protein